MYCIKVIPLPHETSRTIGIGRINPAVRDTFKFRSSTCRAGFLPYPHLP